MKATFQIEWPDDLGESWMNIWNVLSCLTTSCPNTRFTVTGHSADGSPIEATGGPAETSGKVLPE